MKPAATNRRITLLAAAFLLLLGAAFARAVWIQVVKGPEYAAMALRQHRETIVVPASRGTIVDRNGEPLAIGRMATTVYANPRQVTDARNTALTDYVVVVLPAEEKEPLVSSRLIRTVRPDNTGRYQTRGLRPGRYVAAAVEALEQGRQFAPEFQQQLRRGAREFVVREGETVTVDLRMVEGI